jgi:hypothetical protein
MNLLLADVNLTNSLIALHVASIATAFGGVACYPLLVAFVTSRERTALPALLRVIRLLEQRVLSPGLAAVLATGIALAAKEHAWKHFFVGWGFVAVLGIGAIVGAVLGPLEERMIEAAEAQRAEYDALLRRWTAVIALLLLIVLATIFVMAEH